jgi:energy-coupling factor transporter ATP-binding protein EcfA2
MFENMINDLNIISSVIKNNSDEKGNHKPIYEAVIDCITQKLGCNEAQGLLSQQVLSPDQITNLAIELLNIPNPEQKLKEPKMSIYHELEIFNSNDKTIDAPETYFNKICRCSSSTGREYFKSILMAYTDDLEILHRRQSNLMFFNGLELTTEKREYLTQAVKWFSDAEPVLYWNIAKKTPEMQQVLDMLFFSKSWTKFLNYKAGFLGMYYYLLMIISPVWGVISPFVFFFVPYLFARYIIRIPIPFDYYLKQMQDMLFGKQFFAMIGVAQKVFTAFYMGPDNTATLKTKLIDKLFALLQTGLARWLYLLVILASYIYGIYNYIVSSMNYNKLLNFIHERVNYIRKLIDNGVMALNILEPQISRCNELSQIATDCYKLLNANLTSDTNTIETTQLNILKYLREHSIFTKEPGFFSNKGHIIKAYYILEQIDRSELLGPFIKLFGWIDTWMHTATLLSQENSKQNKLCMVNWDVVSDKPILNISDCWSPVGGNITNSFSAPNMVYCHTATGEQTTATGAAITDNDEHENKQSNTSDTVEPLPESVELLPESVEQLPESVELLPESVEQLPESVELLPESVEPLPESVELLPESVELLPESVEQLPESVKLDRDLQLNKNTEKQNTLLTGPNGSGKSTFLKAIMSAVILSQTFGICPATSCKLTPFKYLSTYLNIPDCQGRESLFQAEMRRCHDHLNMLRALEEKHQFSFNIMDEIFVSTNYLEGISGAYGVIKSLEQYPCSMNIITTHFDKLTTVDLPQFSYKYFTINTEEDPNTGEVISIEKDYKLRDGINDKHMALQLLKIRGFDDTLIKNANKMYSQLVAKPE